MNGSPGPTPPILVNTQLREVGDLGNPSNGGGQIGPYFIQ